MNLKNMVLLTALMAPLASSVLHVYANDKSAAEMQTPTPGTNIVFALGEKSGCQVVVSADKGLEQGWQKADPGGEGWTPIHVPAFWDETDIGAYTGYGWYRTTFKVPAGWKGKSVHMLFGAIDEQAWVYLNGQLVREHSVESENLPVNSLWEAPFAAEV